MKSPCPTDRTYQGAPPPPPPDKEKKKTGGGGEESNLHVSLQPSRASLPVELEPVEDVVHHHILVPKLGARLGAAGRPVGEDVTKVIALRHAVGHVREWAL
jgi:hypothetical protein